MGHTSISCREETKERLRELRDGQYISWDQFLVELAEAWDGGESDAEAIADAVAEQVDVPDTISLEATERRAIAEEVAEVLHG